MPFSPAILIAIAAAILTAGAELVHSRRVMRVRHLAFGTDASIPAIVYIVPILRVLALAAMAWAAATLFLGKPKVHRNQVVEEVPAVERRHLVLLLDVSPSMRLQDAGQSSSKTSRTERASALLQSILQRTTDDKLHFSMVAVYNGAKPVVKESRDVEVILNFLDGLPLSSVFPPGKTRLFDGIQEVAEIAKDWPAGSATLVIASDGDTVPASGMPKLPASVGSTLVLGVGDPKQGTFIDGTQSRQDVSTLSQIATRLGGAYHDGNSTHVPTDVLKGLGTLKIEEDKLQLTIREYALITLGVSTFLLAFLPMIMHYFTARFSPGPQAQEGA
ncbi:Ca-activated chloride channel family protein [Rubritalea squalenifaciens DSM 18772]|uniref:Ca-activated chloride channel family protein n=1 Tax=Rubritalea squalenifaciens DSM 18772 TaxID=1123071 RepID=A0A1M6NXQ9_9BACT|nr:vWA domain-containing protein [Rubritalea squalenifaciens]SHK00529.1 Ca-activated chloride channel family protein [Rubritalea squalenifaciens DSM 18772]